MKIGVPKEIKPLEGRVAFLPRHVASLTAPGHEVFVERGAGMLSGVPDEEYVRAGAAVLPSGRDVYAQSVMVVKVKEILHPEYELLRPEHIVFTNIHASLNREQLDRLLEVGLTAVSAENTHPFGSPNCALAGEVGAMEAIRLCFAPHGGTGRHFMGHFGEHPLKALVLGLGNVGRGALRVLLGLGVSVVALDVFEGARRAASLDWHDRNLTVDDISALPRYLPEVDVLINCVLWPKERTDHLVTRAMLGKMKAGAVIVDISCDTAGAIETSRPTSWDDPVYIVDGVRHFCVDNIPGGVPVTASAGYGEAILPRVKAIADKGFVQACREDPWLARGLTCVAGELILAEAARFQKRPYTPVEDWLPRQE